MKSVIRAAALCALAFATSAHAEWLRSSSVHFVVYANDSARDIRTFSQQPGRYNAAMALPSAPSSAQELPKPAVTEAESDALKFARAFLPDTTIAQAGADIERSFGEELKNVPDMAQTERQYPGAIAAMTATGRAMVEKDWAEALPGLRAKLGAVASASFTLADLKEVTAYIASPAGQRMIASLHLPDDSARSAVKNSDGSVSPATGINSAGSANNAGFVVSLPKEEEVLFWSFMRTPAGLAFGKNVPALLKIIAEEGNAQFARLGDAGSARINKALEDHIAAASRPKK